MSSSATFYLPASSGSSSASAGTRHVKVRRWIDASTRDYVVEGGELKQDFGFTSKVVLALGTRKGSCQVLPGFGSRLHEVKRADEQGRKLAEKFARLAVDHLANEVSELKATAALSKAKPGLIEIVVSGRRGEQALSAPYSAVIA